MDYVSPKEYYNQPIADYDLAKGAGFIWFLGQDHLSPMLSNDDEFALHSERWREGISERITAFLSRLDIDSSDLVVDLGSGIGGPARDLVAAAGCKVIGINTSIDQLMASAGHSVRAGVQSSFGLNGDVMKLPFADSSIDHMYSINMQYHVTRPDLMIEEIARVLKPGGRFALEDWFITDTTTDEQLKKLRNNWSATDGFHLLHDVVDLIKTNDLRVIFGDDLSQEAGAFLSPERFGKTFDTQRAAILADAFPKLFQYDGYRPEHVTQAVIQIRQDVLYMGELYRSGQAVYQQIIAEKNPEFDQ